MKFLISLLMVSLISIGYCGGPHGGPKDGHNRPYHHDRHHSSWGKGGENFWPGFIGGTIGGLVGSTFYPRTAVITTTPTVPVVVQPTVVQSTPVLVVKPTRVWVPGHYENIVQPNGIIVKVWVSGHWVD